MATADVTLSPPSSIAVLATAVWMIPATVLLLAGPIVRELPVPCEVELLPVNRAERRAKVKR